MYRAGNPDNTAHPHTRAPSASEPKVVSSISASSNNTSGITKPQMRTTDRITSQPIAAAHSRRQIGSFASRTARTAANTSSVNASNAAKPERPASRILRRHRSDEPARSRSPVRQTDNSSQQHTPVRVFGASKNAAAAQPIMMSGRQQSESAIGRSMRNSVIKTTPISSNQRMSQPPVRKTPSGSGSVRGNGSRAPSAESTSSNTTPVGNSSRRGMRSTMTSSPTVLHRPPPSPSIASASNRAKLGSSLIPRPSERVDPEASAEARRRLYTENRDLKKSLEVEQSTNNELLAQIKEMAAVVEMLSAQIEDAQSEKQVVHNRVSELEEQLDGQRLINRELEKKLGATEALLVAQNNSDSDRATLGSLPSPDVSAKKKGKAAARDSGSSTRPSKHEKELNVASDWRVQLEHTQALCAEGYSILLPSIPKSAMNHEMQTCIKDLETFISSPSRDGKASVARNPSQSSSAYQQNIGPDDLQLAADQPSNRRTPQHRRIVEDERVKRRRSSVIFADFIAKSGKPRRLLDNDDTSSDEDHGARRVSRSIVYGECARCKQLTETLELLQMDNDYYRQANTKLRENVTDVVSKHNALVQLFEKERLRRREIRAQTLAEATRVAANDRAMLEARQRARLEAISTAEETELSRQFDRSVRIASSPTRAF